ncbi:TrlF family AAA-like ATPase [Caulobacter sp.]|uniref:TrlF family AAA-like ATPase n=1 Tax=Caulobacter sp. TaxID=78 RepID=UPI0031DD4BB4
MVEAASRGSVWRRWEPHVHAPGTLFNDQFGGDPWADYLTGLETADPPIEAIGVTDYYSADTYRAVLAHQRQGRLAGVLLFPNVELRLDIATVSGNWANIHLLVSPEDPDHLAELDRFLGRLSFESLNDKFNCTAEDLARFGRKLDPAIVDERAALRHGASQFKVNLSKLRDEYRASAWARTNILIAVAGSKTDGTSGVREAGDTTLRQEIECFAHVIFASSVAQREFWLGRKADSPEQIKARYGGLKPCLHGSDAHDPKRLANPEGRFSWIKGAAVFDALRQAGIDPESRAYVGTAPPAGAPPSQVITEVRIQDAPWAKTPSIPLNPGLVAIIGARGSGKTALADLIAAGADALPDPSHEDRPSASFVARAGSLLDGSSVALDWGSGQTMTRSLTDMGPSFAGERVRYLSQQFVEELCSAEGMTNALLTEVERVIFEAHPVLERDGAVDFAELLGLRADRFRQARQREQQGLVVLSDRIATELEKNRQGPGIAASITLKESQIAGYAADRAKLVTPGSEQRVGRLTELTAAAEKVRGYLRHFANQDQALLSLQDEVKDLRDNQAPEGLRARQATYAAAKLKDDDWNDFLVDFTGDVDAQINAHLKRCRELAASWRGTAPALLTDPATPYVGDGADLTQLPLAILTAEIERLQKLVAVDTDTQRKFETLSTKIVQESALLEALKERLVDAKGAEARVRGLLDDRAAAYRRVFEALSAEEDILRALYQPLMDRLATETGTLKKLTFSVARVADVAQWAKTAEEQLLDLRRQGPFRGRGSFLGAAEAMLKAAWETGDPQAVSQAMDGFRDLYQADLFEHALVARTDAAAYRAWTKRFAQWLYSTDHIEIRYGIEYDDIDIRKLSPGTRGIVLLLLYLALDEADDRPLIIDQPEENLDPKSVHDELVELFIAAKAKRQVIMVTHNANLVVNTDADQIIVAHAGPHARGQLPEITYRSGGLENAAIRKDVCDILEGGEAAFMERARRLRVRLDR